MDQKKRLYTYSGKFLAIICFASFLLLAACTAVPQPTATPEEITNLVTPTAISTTAVPAEPTKTPRATQTPRPTRTPIPTIAPTATYTSSPTPTPIAWHSGITELMRVGNLVWSPTKNEFVSYDSCSGGTEPIIYFVDMNNLEKIDITPKELSCYVSILWHPSGNYFFFSSESREEWQVIEGWQVDVRNLTLKFLEGQSYYWGWLNDELQISEKWSDPDFFFISLSNLITEKNVSYTYFPGSVTDASQNYVILDQEFGSSFNTGTAVLSPEIISPDLSLSWGGPNIKYLGLNIGSGRWEYTFYSRFMDVLPNSDNVLVLTWEDDVFEPFKPIDIISGTIPANLQFWDINTDELSLVKEGGIYGRFSPSGNELVTLTASPDSPQLELTNRHTNEILIKQPAYAESDKYYVDVFAYTSFSPNGRFLTYYSPEQDLIVYDIALGIFLPSVSAVAFTPVWSPDNGRFVYQDRDNGLSIYEVDSQTTYSLTQAGCDELRNPQWSFDGSYLSVDVPCGGTAVLQLP